MDGNSNLEFSILGLKLKFKSNDNEFPEGIFPQDVISYLHDEVENARRKTPNLDDGKLAVLAALKIATDKLALEREYKVNVEYLERKASELQSTIS